MKNPIVYITLCITLLFSCQETTTKNSQDEEKVPVSESDQIMIPKYKPEALSTAALESIKNWIPFNELHQAILTIGANKYTKTIKVDRTNFLLWSEQLDHRKWSKKNIDIKKDAMTSINNELTADAFIGDSTSGYHYIAQGYYTKDMEQLNLSVYVKPGAATLCYLSTESVDPSEKETATFDLKEGTVSYTPDGFDAKIEKLKNNWFRCSITYSTRERGRVVIGATKSPTQYIYDGNGATDLYLWGAQLLNNKEAGNYLKTEGKQESVEEVILYKPSEKEQAIINSSYLKLYYQVDDIYRRILDVEEKDIPEKYNNSFTKSRLRNLKTYTLLLADAIKNNSYLTNEEINKDLHNIYDTYNSILKQINAQNDTSLEKNMQDILNRK
ncbi:hypothetical protein SAMN05216480_101484 [Pustulibacterium marinum]|uniref:Uncharacterized protein n=1 Tax=Pustulibacterium marinum TaxID=1224947 RepID=A0A1I7F013_9FLAO|nr:hypothetical protein [Pustulibacterium marinum]SFU29497.1 hypothetical protein SAMN05216480_101484 [Pustulibacterium marinum]